MSHLSKIEIEIRDLDILRESCTRLGLQFAPNRKSFTWYGGGKECDHVIQVPGAKYEIGVVRNPEGQGYQLVWDSFSGGGLEARLGKGAGRLKQAYAAEKVRKEARLKGYLVREKKTEQGIRLVLSTG